MQKLKSKKQKRKQKSGKTKTKLENKETCAFDIKQMKIKIIIMKIHTKIKGKKLYQIINKINEMKNK